MGLSSAWLRQVGRRVAWWRGEQQCDTKFEIVQGGAYGANKGLGSRSSLGTRGGPLDCPRFVLAGRGNGGRRHTTAHASTAHIAALHSAGHAGLLSKGP